DREEAERARQAEEEPPDAVPARGSAEHAAILAPFRPTCRQASGTRVSLGTSLAEIRRTSLRTPPGDATARALQRRCALRDDAGRLCRRRVIAVWRHRASCRRRADPADRDGGRLHPAWRDFLPESEPVGIRGWTGHRARRRGS